MTPEVFFDNFAHLADAPNGVKKLRELILQLAVRGKLVPQDSSDEPAAILLERIQVEKALLVKEKKIRKSELLSPVSDDEVPYELPQGWTWERIEETFYPISTSGNKINTCNMSEKGKLPVIDQGQSHIAGFIDDVDKIISIPGPVIVFGDHTRAIKYIDFDFVAGADGVKILRPMLFEPYFFWVLKSYNIESRGYGRHYSILLSNLFPLPPLAEQHRIVAKVDQLMSLCDELENRQQKKHKKLTRLNNAALDQLTSARDSDYFTTAWQLVRDNFDLLYTTPETIAKLRQSILQLAVQGKLVPQDPNDEPASVLLERIRAEKERLVKEKKIRKSEPLPPVSADEVPYERPQGWEIQRFIELTDIVGGVTKGRNLVGRNTASFPYLRVANVQRGYLDLDVMKEIEIPVEELEKYKLSLGDLLITEGGDWDKVGRTAIWDCQVGVCIHQNHVFRARLFDDLLNRFWVMQFFNSSQGRRYFEKASKQTTNLASINMTQLRNCPIPIPPPAEQRRIVAKVDQLMSLCDTLESCLTKAQVKADKLTASTVQSLLAT